MRFPHDFVEWWQYLFLALALVGWPVLYVRSCLRLSRDRKRPDIQYLAHLLAFGAGGSWLLSLGLSFMPMLAVLCIMFSVCVSLAALVLAALTSWSRADHERGH